LRFVTDRVLEAQHGPGGVLLVAGRAGVGKTMLTERAAERASAAGMVVAWSRCVEGIATPAFWPWVQLLRALPPSLVDRHLLDALTGRAEPAGTDGDPDAARFHLFEAAGQALRALSEHESALLILDDIHLADASSLQLLAHVAAGVDRLPILLLATMRSEPGELTQPVRDMLGALAQERGVQRLSLQPFTHEDVREYLRVEFARDRDGGEGDHSDPDDTVVTALHERTGGNPFYLKELLRLLDSEHLGGWGTAEAVAESVVPDGVRDVIGRRVARLPEDTQALLRAAAVIGRDVDADLLQATAGLDPERMLSVLEPAVATGLLVEMSGSWDYQFSHALVRDALYAELSRLQRSRIHRRVGEAMEGLSSTDDLVTVGRLAYHFAAAARLGVSAKAVAYCQRAAELAEAQLAYDEAVEFLTTALGALEPADPDARHRRCALLVALGKARRLAGDVIGAREVLDEAATLGTQLGEDGLVIDAVTVFGGVTHWNWRAYGQTDARMIAIISDQLARLDPADHVRRAALLGTLGVELFYGERRDEGERFADEAVGLARRYGDVELRARTLNNFCVAAWIPHRDDARVRAVTELLGLGPLPRRVEIIARLHRMMLLMSAGDLSAYDIDLNRCRLLAVEVRSSELAAQVTYAAGGRAMLDGRWDEGERLVHEAAEEQARTSLWGGQWIRLTLLYTSRRFQGRPADLLDELIHQANDDELALLRVTAVLAACESGDEPLALELLHRWGFVVRLDWSWDFVMYQWGLVAARLGAPDPAAIYDELAPFADRFVSVGSGGASWGSNRYVLAALADRLGRPEEAAAHAKAGLSAHERLGAGHLIAASQRQLAMLASSGPRS
jgi:hypothetical protein